MIRISFNKFLMLMIASSFIAACNDKLKPDQVASDERVIRADVVALEQPLYYNRFGSVNPYGMIYALKHDVVNVQEGEEWLPGLDCPSAVRLRDGKRPRPLVLRGNVDDVLEITFTNELLNEQPDISNCKLVDADSPYSHFLNEADRVPPIDPPEHEPRAEEVEPNTATENSEYEIKMEPGTDWPLTRSANLVIPGLTSLSSNDLRCNGLESIEPGESITCRWKLEREGSHLFSSHGAPAGGEGEGGSLTHGLFGVVIVEPKDSQWYRSQVSAAVLDAVWPRRHANDDARHGSLDYDAVDANGNPYLNMLKSTGQTDETGRKIYDLIHSDLNAVIWEANPENPEAPAFREFTVVFHDELKTFYANQFQELETSRQLSGVRDGFAINYGASGMGSILLANRKGIGPSAECVECLYEEFFLQSWANGDPALLENFVDDPSNVHHSYLNDRIKFRNLHAGPKETHVFHLHAHQWISSADGNSGTYLDSQTIAPQQGFDYEIYDGGLSHWGTSDWHLTNGSGNRNRTPGDSIFHCHLYPHFAQGMWALWRTHDVIEDGTRKLPDGQASVNLIGNPQIALSTSRQDAQGKRTGTDPITGFNGDGTPIPALLPLPGQGLPPLPYYDVAEGMPGYPFYIPGEPGHRAPQPPLDFAKNEQEHLLHGGLPRHVFHGGKRKPVFLTDEDIDQLPEDATERANTLLRQSLAVGDFRLELTQADLALLDHEGEPLERQAMDFHAGQTVKIRLADGTIVNKDESPGYPTLTPDGSKARFFVNGAPPKPGAPFADPCGAPDAVGKSVDDIFTDEKMSSDPALAGFRGYEVSAIGLDLVVNRAGWHDPQARINVLTKDAEDVEHQRRHDMEPFFFRAASGECIEFKHQNRTHKELELDDFQVATPTDTIGQHIHLVKFDVTSSDGSGNGFNYEDGTLARGTVEERIKAANALGGARAQETRRQLSPGKTLDGESIDAYQTTIQRWFADPLLTVNAEKDANNMHAMHKTERPDMPCPTDPAKECLDRTLRTVFTHDHFAPSSIQQHGFYSALLIEPAGSKWLKPDGTAMEDDDGQAVGSKAMIVGAKDWLTHENHREFALAVADFALLYDPRLDDEVETQGMGRLLSEADKAKQATTGSLPSTAVEWLHAHAQKWWKQNGRPVDPPFKPEAISKDHHNPYLVNYKHEPIPLRIGQMDDKLQIPEDTLCGLNAVDFDEDGQPILEKRQSVMRQKDGLEGDLAFVFATREHGDPCTPILEAYEGEKVQIRMVQGAQEVQHMFAIEGLSWPRVINYGIDKDLSAIELAKRDNPKGLVAAQEIGISEHFEMQLPAFGNVGEGRDASDYLFHYGTVDALWNGTWGLIRVYNGKHVSDPEACQQNDGTQGAEKWFSRRNPYLPESPFGPASAEFCQQEIGQRLEPLPGHKTGMIVVNKEEFFPEELPDGCPAGSNLVNFSVAATRVDLLTESKESLFYDKAHGLYDPDGLVLLPMPPDKSRITLEDVRQELRNRHGSDTDNGISKLEPLVLRVNANDCVQLAVHNLLLDKGEDTLPDAPGDALMPKIVPLNVDQSEETEVDDVRPSARLALSVSLLTGRPAYDHNLGIGINRSREPLTSFTGAQVPKQTLQFYAGRLDLKAAESTEGVPDCPKDEPCPFVITKTPYAFGTIPIKAVGDVLGHGVHGLFGTLIVEPQGATYHDTLTLAQKSGWELGTEAIIRYQDESGEDREFREFVLAYQDGVNLHWPSPWDETGKPLPNGETVDAVVADCPICDDSYDRGQKAINYRSAPFWARLRQGVGPDGTQIVNDTNAGSNLNQFHFPENFFQKSWSLIPTPVFIAKEGEEVRFRVSQPHGRARQRAFVSFGHDYKDLLPEFGSPHAALMSPGKAITATLENGAKSGCYLYRDGPMQMFAGGVWGHFRVNPADGVSLKCESPTLAKGP